jgi:predicted dinucleotide-binding enzyme
MQIAVFGTGTVGRALAEAWSAAGHDVVIGTRDPVVTHARDDWDVDLPLASFADAGAGADVVVTAVRGVGALDALAAAGPGVDGAVVLDVSNPLDSTGFPPTLLVKDTDSLAEQLQRAHPDARVVKSLNTVNASVMVDPQSVADGAHTMFVAGDDADARDVVRRLLQDLGWTDIVEFDSLEAARGLEMYLPLWIRLMQRYGHARFNVRIVGR